MDREPIVECGKARSSSPSSIKISATVPAVTSILRCIRRLVAASGEAVISANGTRASLGPMPINSTRNVSIATAAVIDVWSVPKCGPDEGFGGWRTGSQQAQPPVTECYGDLRQSQLGLMIR